MAMLSPSVLTCDFLDFKDKLSELEKLGIDMLHLDVMDGNFVPNITFGVPLIKSIRKYTNIPIDTHLMIDKPHRYIEEFAKYSDWLGFHYEAGSDCEETLKKIRDLGLKSTITIKPQTKAEEIFLNFYRFVIWCLLCRLSLALADRSLWKTHSVKSPH